MEELFAGADALVLPYRHIDQSGVLFQALRLGLPVVATRSGSMADYVSSEVGELCEPGSTKDLREAIVRLAGRLDRLSRSRIRQLGQRFEWSATVACLSDVYARPDRRARASDGGPILFIGEGRLGNQVFQYAAIRALLGEGTLYSTGLGALHRVFEPLPGLRHILGKRPVEPVVRRIVTPSVIRPAFKHLRLGSYCHEPEHEEPAGHAGLSGLMTRQRGLLPLSFVDGGHYQNLSNLLAPRDFLRLRIRPDVLAGARSLLDHVLGGRVWPRVVMHVRRGDYVGWSAYGLQSVLLPDDYFGRAMREARRHAGECAEILVVSDDVAWCERELAAFGPVQVVSASEEIDFALLSMFPVVILSNSTFSLAAACVGRQVELVIGPKFWFGHAVGRWLPFHIRASDPRFVYV